MRAARSSRRRAGHITGIALHFPGVCVALAVVILLGVVGVQDSEAQGRESSHLSWLALGDSFSAGEGIPGTTRVRNMDGKECSRATGYLDDKTPSDAKAWAVVAFEQVGRDLFDTQQFVACTGGINDDIPAQIEEAEKGGLTSWDAITFSSGGNNIKFSDIIFGCLDIDHWSERLDFTHGCDITAEQARKRIAMLTGEVPIDDKEYSGDEEYTLPALYDLAAARVRPGGLVVVAGYPHIVEELDRWSFAQRNVLQSCEFLAPKDMGLLRGIATDLNAAIAEQVRQAGERWSSRGVRFQYADFANEVYETDEGRHNLCGGDQWVNGVTLGVTSGDIRAYRSFHPTQEGHTASGQYVAGLVLTHPWSAGAPVELEPEVWGGIAAPQQGGGTEFPVLIEIGRAENGLPVGVSVNLTSGCASSLSSPVSTGKGITFDRTIFFGAERCVGGPVSLTPAGDELEYSAGLEGATYSGLLSRVDPVDGSIVGTWTGDFDESTATGTGSVTITFAAQPDGTVVGELDNQGCTSTLQQVVAAGESGLEVYGFVATNTGANACGPSMDVLVGPRGDSGQLGARFFEGLSTGSATLTKSPDPGAGPNAGAESRSSFETPSGNILCSMWGEDWIACRILEADFDAGTCPDIQPGIVASLAQTGAAAELSPCQGDTFAETAADPGQAPYGSRIDLNGIVCEVSEQGVRCTNQVGHGFTLARSGFQGF